jgi:hypothetical protein
MTRLVSINQLIVITTIHGWIVFEMVTTPAERETGNPSQRDIDPLPSSFYHFQNAANGRLSFGSHQEEPLRKTGYAATKSLKKDRTLAERHPVEATILV